MYSRRMWTSASATVPLVLTPVRKGPKGQQGPLQFEDGTLDFFACFRDRQYVPAKVRAFVDYLLEVLPGHPSLERPPDGNHLGNLGCDNHHGVF